MAKDKLITIRIEEDKRDTFKSWAESRGKDVSGFLYEVIDACLAGRLDESIVAQELDTDRLDEMVRERLDKNLDTRIETAVSQAVATATASLRSEFAPALDAHREVEALLGK